MKRTTLTGFIGALLATPVEAHSFGQPYQLPMPYWMYIYGAMAALALSFVVLAFFLREDTGDRQARRLVGVALILACLARSALRVARAVLGAVRYEVAPGAAVAAWLAR